MNNVIKINNQTLIEGDCRKELLEIGSSTIDLIVTSPP